MGELEPTHYPPIIDPGFLGVPAPHGAKYGYEYYFRDYRNENLSRDLARRYDWGSMDILYVAKTNSVGLGKAKKFDKFLKLPQSQFSMLDVGRQNEIDNFYSACQKHRDQYKDQTYHLTPLDYFKIRGTKCGVHIDCTSKYLKSPNRYVKYKDPLVWPLTLERTRRFPYLPERALTGTYDPSSNIQYKR